MSSSPSLDALEVRVQNLEKNVEDIKTERRESQKLLTETLKTLQDNTVRQTALMEKMEQRAEKQDVRLDKMDEKLDQVNIDVQTIKVRSETMRSDDTNNESTEKTNWYQSFITSDRKFLWFILLIVLLTALGMKAPEIMSFLKLLI